MIVGEVASTTTVCVDHPMGNAETEAVLNEYREQFEAASTDQDVVGSTIINTEQETHGQTRQDNG